MRSHRLCLREAALTLVAPSLRERIISMPWAATVATWKTLPGAVETSKRQEPLMVRIATVSLYIFLYTWRKAFTVELVTVTKALVSLRAQVTGTVL